MMDNGLEQVVEEFLDALSLNEALGLLPLSDKALDFLPQMAGYIWSPYEEGSMCVSQATSRPMGETDGRG
jgi:hypothetical protein